MILSQTKRIWILLLAVLVAAGGIFAGILVHRHARQAPSINQQISNYQEVIGSIRHGLRVHSSCITVQFRYPDDVLEELTGVVGSWVEEALRETDDPTEGDYIRYQYDGYSIECRYDTEDGGQKLYTVDITPRYYMYLVQEEAVTEQLQAVYASFGFNAATPDYEKIRTIYDYICTHVSYDQIHKHSKYYHMKSTSYAALIRQTATCQGYCVLLYRMLRDNGVGCRIVTGTAYSEDHAEFHAWNLVALDGVWYALDPTWDAGAETWRCFLRGSRQFTDHVPGADFQTAAFRREYPMAKQDYAPKF